MYNVGIDIGSVSINCVVLDENGELIYEAPYQRHFGRFVPQTLQTLQSIYERFDEQHIWSVSFTGNHAKFIASRLKALFEYESITQVLGVLYVVPDASAIISMGGQDAGLFMLNHKDGQWYLQSFAMNGPCAAGTVLLLISKQKDCLHLFTTKMPPSPKSTSPRFLPAS